MTALACLSLISECAKPAQGVSAALEAALRSRTYNLISELINQFDQFPQGDINTPINLKFIECTLDQWDECIFSVMPGLGSLDSPVILNDGLIYFYCWLISIGVGGEWSIYLNVPRNTFIGSIEVKLEGRVYCCSDGIQCNITFLDSYYKFERLDKTSPWTLLKSLPINNNMDLVGQCVLYHEQCILHSEKFTGGLQMAPAQHAVRNVSEAFNAIETASLMVSQWVKKVIKGVVLVKTEENSIKSGSSPEFPGLVFVSHPIDVEHLAVLLVHEAAHIYYYILAHHVWLIEPNSTEKLFSPFKGVNRPVFRVLLALHACENIVKYTSSRISRGLGNHVLKIEHENTQIAIRKMTESLSSAKTLTPEGRLLIEIMGSM